MGLEGRRIKCFVGKYFVDEMKPYLGKVGVVTEIIEPQMFVRVEFEDNQFWYFDIHEAKENMISDCNKVIRCIIDNENTFVALKKGICYPVLEEEEKFYYIKFNDRKIKYPKHYFIEVHEEK